LRFLKNRLRGSDGRFVGARLNLESVPRLPAYIFGATLHADRALRLLWRWYDGEVREDVTASVSNERLLIRRRDGDEVLAGLELLRYPATSAYRRSGAGKQGQVPHVRCRVRTGADGPICASWPSPLESPS
jgi:hypothetical protein